MAEEAGQATGTQAADGAAPPASDAGAQPAPAAGGDDAPLTDAEYADLIGKINFFDALPEDMRRDPNIAKFKDSGIEGLAKAHISAVSMIGRDKVPIPQAGDERGWEDFFKAAGRPDTSDGYEFKEVADLPKGFEYDKGVEGAFREIAHKAGLNVQQAQTLRDFYVGMQAEAFKGQGADTAAKREQGIQALKEKWGNAFEQKLDAASRTMRALTSEEFVSYLNETGLGDDPRMIEAFAGLASKVGGDKALIGAGAVTEDTPAELDAKIADFRNTHHEILMNKLHPQHDLRVKELTALFNKRYPEKRPSEAA